VADGEGSAVRLRVKHVLAFSLRSALNPLRPANLIPLAALLAGVLVGATATRAYPIRFFEAASQIIPVLLLALAIELRAFEFPRIGPLFREVLHAEGLLDDRMLDLQRVLSDWVPLLAVLGTLIVAEGWALILLSSGPSEWLLGQGIVLGAMFAGLAMIGYTALVGAPSREKV
jgi:hypothetical protein